MNERNKNLIPKTYDNRNWNIIEFKELK